MLTRRSARIKVMQVIYSHLQSEGLEAGLLRKNVSARILQSYDILLHLLLLIRETGLYLETYNRIRNSRLLPLEEEKDAGTRLLENPNLRLLSNDSHFNSELKKRKIPAPSADLIRPTFLTLIGKEEYRKYNAGDKNDQDHSDILNFLLKKVLLKSEPFYLYIEEQYPVWSDDHETIIYTLDLVMKELGKGAKLGTLIKDQKEKLKEIEDFAVELFRVTFSHMDEFSAMLTPRIRNWDVERIAMVDMILMKMALAEILYFPSIPVKVTINEYIDISKRYSTPKSKEFINGVLDKIMKDLRQEGKIVKTGRGLLEQ